MWKKMETKMGEEKKKKVDVLSLSIVEKARPISLWGQGSVDAKISLLSFANEISF